MSDSKYRTLKSIFHQYGEAKAKEMSIQRRESEGAWQMPFKMNEDPCFVYPSRELNLLIDHIHKKNTVLHSLMADLPYLSILLNDSLLTEIEMSNEIEGIHSSRRELREALASNRKSGSRFAGMVRQYQKLISGEPHSFPESAEEIRKIYDEMFLDEIIRSDPENQPDGRLFRINPVYITDGIRRCHTGVNPEDKIIEMMNSSLLMIKDQEIPGLIRAAAFHFIFGYIHPFYDGNGRMSRYLSALFLLEDLGKPAAMHLSLALREQRARYYKAFEVCESEFNFADLTPFVIFFLDALDHALTHEITVITEKKKTFEKYQKKISAVTKKKSSIDTYFLTFLAMHTLFSADGVRKKEIAQALEKSENTVNELLKKYHPYIFSQQDGRYKNYMLSDQFLTLSDSLSHKVNRPAVLKQKP